MIWDMVHKGVPGVYKEPQVPQWCLWPTLMGVPSMCESSCGCSLCHGTSIGETSLPLSVCSEILSGLSWRQSSICLLYLCTCEGLSIPRVPISCFKYLWYALQRPTHSLHTWWGHWSWCPLLFRALISQGIVQFMGKWVWRSHGCLFSVTLQNYCSENYFQTVEGNCISW